MADAVATMIFILLLMAFGWTGGCSMQGPGFTYRVDGQSHHLLLRGINPN